MMTNEYLTKNETAALLRISKVTLQRIVNSGKLRKIKIVGKVLFARVDVDAFIDASATGGAGGAE